MYGADYVAANSHTVDESNVAITGGSITGISDLAIADGGTGASTAAAARTNLGAAVIVQLFCSAGNPADGATYFIGAGVGAITVLTASGMGRVPLPIPSGETRTITRVALHIGVGGTTGTTEQATASIRLNNTTDTTISPAVQFNALSQFYYADVSIPVDENDYIEGKIVMPTFSTNPTVVVAVFSVWIE